MAIIKDKIKRAALKTAEEVRSPKDLKTALVLSGGASRGRVAGEA